MSVKNGTMREDFFYRINVIPVFIPPLRERREDIPLLIEHFLEKFDPAGHTELSGGIIEAMKKHDWPGNVRELQNTLHRYATLKVLDFMGGKGDEANPGETADLLAESEDHDLRSVMESVERKYIERVLEKNQWRRDKAAMSLGIDPKTLYRKIRQHGL